MSMLKAKQIRLLEGEIIVGSAAGNGRVLSLGEQYKVAVSSGSTLAYEYMGALRDTAGVLVVETTGDANAVNHVLVGNAASGSSPTISAIGTDTDLNLNLAPKGVGEVLVPTSYTPVSDYALTHKKYVDDKVTAATNGLDVKASVRAMATTAITLSGVQTVDGVTLQAGDRVLVAGQGGDVETGDATNGIYVVASGEWTRSADFDEPSEVTANAFVFVEEGATWADTGWVVLTNNPITVGTSPMQWTQFSTPGLLKAGNGLNKVGDTFHVNTSTTVNVDITDNVIVASSGTAGQVLRSTGVVGAEAAWGALDLANNEAVTGILRPVNGGTGFDSYTTGDLLVGNATNGLDKLSMGDANTVLTSLGSSVAYQYVRSLRNAAGDLTLDVDATGGVDNILTVSTSATGGAVKIAATGTDSNIDLKLEGKGVGLVLGHAGYVTLDATDPDNALTPKGYVDAEITKLADNLHTDNLTSDDGSAGGSTMILDGISVTNAVNYLTVTNAAVAGDVVIGVDGTDSSIDLVLAPKGAGFVLAPTGYTMAAAPVEALTTKGYVDAQDAAINRKVANDEWEYSGATVATGTVTLAAFFAHAPLAGSVAVTFNGLRLKTANFSVSGMDLILDIDAIGYSVETTDVVAASYEYLV